MLGIRRFSLFVFFLLTFILSFKPGYSLFQFPIIDTLNIQNISRNDSLLIDGYRNKFYEFEQDSLRIKLINEMCDELSGEYPVMAYSNWVIQQCRQRLKELSSEKESLFYWKNLSSALINLGICNKRLGNAIDSYNNYLEAEKLAIQSADDKLLSTCLNNLGAHALRFGDLASALNYYLKCLEIRKKNNDQKGLIFIYNNLGLFYTGQNDYELAKEYYEKSIQNAIDLELQPLQAGIYNNMGLMYFESGNIQQASKYYLKSKDLYLLLDYPLGLSQIYANLGILYQKQKDYISAKAHHEMSLKIRKDHGYLNGVSESYHNLGTLAWNQKNAQMSLDYCKKGLEVAQEIGSLEYIKRNSKCICVAEKSLHNYKKAFNMYKLFLTQSDSLSNIRIQKAVVHHQTLHEIEKVKLMNDQIEKETKEMKKADIDRRDNLQYSVILVFIAGVFGVILFLGLISVSAKIGEILIFFGLLLIFESVLVFSDPYMEVFTSGTPGWKLLINAFIAVLFFPLHKFFNRKLKFKLLIRRKTKIYND